MGVRRGEGKGDIENLSRPSMESRDQVSGKVCMWMFFQERALQKN